MTDQADTTPDEGAHQATRQRRDDARDRQIIYCQPQHDFEARGMKSLAEGQ